MISLKNVIRNQPHTGNWTRRRHNPDFLFHCGGLRSARSACKQARHPAAADALPFRNRDVHTRGARPHVPRLTPLVHSQTRAVLCGYGLVQRMLPSSGKCREDARLRLHWRLPQVSDGVKRDGSCRGLRECSRPVGCPPPPAAVDPAFSKSIRRGRLSVHGEEPM